MAILVIGTSIWVYSDIKKLGIKAGYEPSKVNSNAIGWLIICLLLWIIAFPYYLFTRRKLINAHAVLDDNNIQCEGCQSYFSKDSIFCPHCGKSTKNVCLRCKKRFENCSFCPDCGDKLA